MASTQVITRTVIEEYLNSKRQLTTELSQIYQCPTTKKAAIILLCQAANITSIYDAYLSIGWKDQSDKDTLTYLLYEGVVPPRSALNVIYSKLILEPGDSIVAKANEMNRLQITLSILEIS